MNNQNCRACSTSRDNGIGNTGTPEHRSIPKHYGTFRNTRKTQNTPPPKKKTGTPPKKTRTPPKIPRAQICYR